MIQRRTLVKAVIAALAPLSMTSAAMTAKRG